MPGSPEIFSCLADGRDHSPCCAERGVPAECGELCSGNLTQLSFRHFSCLQYMQVMSSCLLEGYGVLPSRPRHFTFSNLKPDFAILEWEPPTRLPHTVIGEIILILAFVFAGWVPLVCLVRSASSN